ncbi:hypothetical protein NI467_04540 [Acinetobacter bohemicus]|uniref:hypothetical protein n=1 Tax=Acinetobacter sp. S4397-1 TaxID=2972915 RepID=UPI00209A7026|nr:hypothetical protein [Acinetobacter sp. S4397-1]MCO8044622.1 hypothetical protein [Acinetobacter sp. S4397-1]
MPTQADLIFNQELAAWVQAIGSVIAIFVAISVPLYLNHLAQNRDDALQDKQKQKYFVTLLPTLYRIRRYSSEFIQQMQSHQQSTQNILQTLETEYLELIPVFSRELHIFVHSQIYDSNLNQLAFELFHSEEILQQHLLQPQDQKQLKHQALLSKHSQHIHDLSHQLIMQIEKIYALQD